MGVSFWVSFLCCVSLFAEPIYVAHGASGGLSFLEKTRLDSAAFLPLLHSSPQKILGQDNRLYLISAESSWIEIIDAKLQTAVGRIDCGLPIMDACLWRNCLFATSVNNLIAVDLTEQEILYAIAHNLTGSLRIAVEEKGRFACMTGDGGCLQTFDLEKRLAQEKVVAAKGDLCALCSIPGTSLMLIAESSYDYELFIWDEEKQTKKILCTCVHQVEGGTDLCFAPDGDVVYLLGKDTANIGKITWQEGRVEQLVPVALGSRSFAITEEGSFLYVASPEENLIDVFDLASFDRCPPARFPYPCNAIYIPHRELVEKVRGEQQSARFLSAKQRVNVLEWSSSYPDEIAHYIVKKEGNFFRKVSSQSQMRLEDRRVQEGRKVLYEIVPVSASGTCAKSYWIEI